MGLIHTVMRPPLSEFVDFLWLAEGYMQPHATELVVPTGSMELVLNLDEHGQAGDVLSGMRTKSILLDTSNPLHLLGARFKPGGAFAFLSFPADELQDLTVSTETVWGANSRFLREQLLGARSPALRLRLVERFLLQQLHRRPDRHPAVRYAVNSSQQSTRTPSVASVVERTGLTWRRFIAAFRNEVGQTPKVFCRIARFRHVIASIESSPVVDWAAVALECGCSDQSHLIHDFHAFSGISPSAYLRHRTSPNHVRIPGPAR
jgi:AraC-like DNA-binding protein